MGCRLLFCLFGVDVDELGTHLGVDDLLALVQAAVAAEQVADSAGHAEEHQILRAEQLHAEHDGGQRRIHRTGDVSSSKLIRFPDIDQNGAGSSAVLLEASIDVSE